MRASGFRAPATLVVATLLWVPACTGMMGRPADAGWPDGDSMPDGSADGDADGSADGDAEGDAEGDAGADADGGGECDDADCAAECVSLGYAGGACDAAGACECVPPGPACGNDTCETGEDCASCPEDCGACPAVCGNGSCEAGESTEGCPGDCCPVTDTVYVDPGESIQAAMDCAQTYARSHTAEWPDHTRGDALYGRVVINPGTHDLHAPLATRAHVRIEAYGAEIINRSGSHIMHVDDNGGGGYDAPATYWTIVGGDWNANGGGGFSIVHTRKFVMWDMEIRDIGYFGHHLEINSSGGEYVPGVYNVVIHAVRIHGVASDARIDDEGINIDYSWAGAAHNTANDGTVPNNVLIQDCEFYDVPRAVSSHHFQTDGGAPVAEFSGITIQGGWFHDIDPSSAATGDNFQNDGAIRVYGWQNVVIEGVTFTNCATAISLFAPADFPDFLGSVGSFVIRDNTFEACGLARSDGVALPVIYSRSSNPETSFWDVVVSGNTVTGDWVATGQYFVATWDTHNCWITGNHFAPTSLTVAEERAYNKYKARGDSNTGTWDLSGNTVSDGSEDNS